MKLEIKPNMILENKLQNGSVIVVRVVEFIELVGQWRVTDAREVRDDAWLIKNNRTWAAPVENLQLADGVVRHKNGLTNFGE